MIRSGTEATLQRGGGHDFKCETNEIQASTVGHSYLIARMIRPSTETTLQKGTVVSDAKNINEI